MRNGDVADLFVGRQEGLDRDRIGDLAHADDVAGDFEDLPVQRLVKMRGLEEVGHPVIGVVVHQDGAEQRLFGLDVVRRFAIVLLCRSNGGNLSCSFVHRHPYCLFPKLGFAGRAA